MMTNFFAPPPEQPADLDSDLETFMAYAGDDEEIRVALAVTWIMAGVRCVARETDRITAREVLKHLAEWTDAELME